MNILKTLDPDDEVQLRCGSHVEGELIVRGCLDLGPYFTLLGRLSRVWLVVSRLWFLIWHHKMSDTNQTTQNEKATERVNKKCQAAQCDLKSVCDLCQGMLLKYYDPFRSCRTTWVTGESWIWFDSLQSTTGCPDAKGIEGFILSNLTC